MLAVVLYRSCLIRTTGHIIFKSFELVEALTILRYCNRVTLDPMHANVVFCVRDTFVSRQFHRVKSMTKAVGMLSV